MQPPRKDEDELDDAVSGAAWRTVGDRQVWGRRKSATDVSMLEAATLAAHAAEKFASAEEADMTAGLAEIVGVPRARRLRHHRGRRGPGLRALAVLTAGLSWSAVGVIVLYVAVSSARRREARAGSIVTFLGSVLGARNAIAAENPAAADLATLLQRSASRRPTPARTSTRSPRSACPRCGGR